MTFGAIIGALRDYAMIGIVLAVLFAAGVWAVQKKTKKKFSVRRVAVTAIFICYSAIVLYATLLGRGSWYGGSVDLELFSSYKLAWYQFSETEWRNLILNILLFVPMGFLLPAVFRKEDRFWKVYLSGFLLSAGIELLQYVLKRGIVEADDVFNNTLGTMIGYGVWAIVCFIYREISGRLPKDDVTRKKEVKMQGALTWMEKKEQRIQSIGKCIALQLPLILTCSVFSALFIGYERQPFGNLLACYHHNGIKNVQLADNLELSAESPELYVYLVPVGTKEDLFDYADKLLAPVGQTVDPKENDEYDETIVFRSEDQEHTVWVDYKGMTSEYNDFTLMDDQMAAGWSRDEVAALLENYGVTIPEKAEFLNQEDGSYRFTAEQIEDETGIWDGYLTCTVTREGKIKDYSNHLYHAKAYASARCLSEQDAYDRAREGKFYVADMFSVSDIVLESITLGYEMDSKGFYQPVYVFSVKGEEFNVVIPAWIR